MNTDQIAAEAWDKIARYYQIQIADGTGIEHIKAAIEKATEELAKQFVDMKAYANHLEIKLSAAHASEQP